MRRSIRARRSSGSASRRCTSMFLVGKNDRRVDDDWRPEIHDSDGLQMWTGAGEWIWRPLINPERAARQRLRRRATRAASACMQRERRFAQYQDDGVFYDKRPDCWVEPKGSWGKGGGHAGGDPDARTRPSTTSSRSGARRTSRSLARSICTATGCTGAARIRWQPISRRVHATRDRHRRHRRPEAHLFLRGASWSTSRAANSGCSVRMPKCVPVITASARARRDHLGAAVAADQAASARCSISVPDDSEQPINLRLYLSRTGRR